MYHDHKVEAVVIALNADKACDQIECEYMMSVLEHFVFGKERINWIKNYLCTPNGVRGNQSGNVAGIPPVQGLPDRGVLFRLTPLLLSFVHVPI